MKAWVIPPSPERGSDEIVLVGVSGRRGARGDVELDEDIADVAVDGLLAEHEFAGDRLVGLAGGDEAQHLQLARRQSVRRRRRGVGMRSEKREVRRRSEFL